MRFAIAAALALTVCAVAFTQPAKPDPEQVKRDVEAAETGAKILGLGVGAIVAITITSCIFQLIPIVIAISRGHPDVVAITAVSLLLGWCCIGWVIALVWSLKAFVAKPDHYA